MQQPKLLDMSLGDPVVPFRSLANHAFSAARKEAANKYQLFNTTRWERDPVAEALVPVPSYLRSRGIDRELAVLSSLFVSSGGTTRAYELLINFLADDVQKRNERARQKIKPVIIMPVPTYGYFFEAPKKRRIEIVTLPRDMKTGCVDPALLDETLSRLNAEGKRVIAYYDSNPNNPLGTIRSKANTVTIAKVLDRHSDLYREDEMKRLTRRFGYQTARVRYWDGPASRICKIDDLVYDGLEYKDQEQAFSFGQLEGCEKDTFLLFGVSKVGFVTARAGLVVGYSGHIQKLARENINHEYFPSVVAAHAIEGYLNNDEPFASKRKKHLDTLNAGHEFNGKFMKALINGIHDVPEASPEDVERMVRLLSRHGHMSFDAARQRLQTGIPGVQVLTSPKAGFFHLINFGSLKGVVSKLKRDFECCEERLAKIFEEKVRIKFATGGYTGLDPQEDLVMRATFALPPRDIVDFASRVEHLMNSNEFRPAPSREELSIPVVA